MCVNIVFFSFSKSRERFYSSEKEIDERVIDCKLRTVSALISIPVTVIASTSAVVVYRLFLIFCLLMEFVDDEWDFRNF